MKYQISLFLFLLPLQLKWKRYSQASSLLKFQQQQKWKQRILVFQICFLVINWCNKTNLEVAHITHLGSFLNSSMPLLYYCLFAWRHTKEKRKNQLSFQDPELTSMEEVCLQSQWQKSDTIINEFQLFFYSFALLAFDAWVFLLVK